MTEQFSTPRFARGVRVTVQHQYTPLQGVAAAAATSAVASTRENLGRCRASWVLPWIGPEAAENGSAATSASPLFVWPFTLPPFQELFDRDSKRDPGYAVNLTELSFSFDQRAEALAVTGDNSTTSAGNLTGSDLSRYSMTLRLLERTPHVSPIANAVIPADYATSEILSVDLNGPDLFGNVFVRTNPVLVDGLNVSLKPYSVYMWELSCPGLYDVDANPGAPTKEQLALVSLNLSAVFVSPLLPRDSQPAGDLTIQNLPLKHLGRRDGVTLPVTVPAGDATITGDDIQSANHVFDAILRNRLRSGYGAGYGALADPMQALDADPHEMLANDAHYMMIVVPMWSGQRRNSIRREDVADAGLPYTDLDAVTWKEPAFDRRIVPVPDGFVLHHAFASVNYDSPPAPLCPKAPNAARAGWGTRSVAATYKQCIGVSLSTGWNGDDYTQQQVAYQEFTGARALSEYVIDRYATRTGSSVYELATVPIVGAASSTRTWIADSGLPFLMGKGNSATAPRTYAGQMPPGLGGGAYAAVSTAGQENVLEVRWTKEDSAGLDVGTATDVIVGQGGEFILLCGKVTVSGQ